MHLVKIKSISEVTHNVLGIVTEKPEGFVFSPGQATEVSINKEGWESQKRPFTFTSLPANNYLEFTIKTYTDHDGVTNQLRSLRENDELLLDDVFGAIAYKGEGTFIAGGAGVTPFISIFRDLESKGEIGNNKLIFANKTKDDIILKETFEKLLGKNFINILSDELVDNYAHGFITAEFLKQHINSPEEVIYLCGPEPMMEAVENHLGKLGVDRESIVKEEF